MTLKGDDYHWKVLFEIGMVLDPTRLSSMAELMPKYKETIIIYMLADDYYMSTQRGISSEKLLEMLTWYKYDYFVNYVNSWTDSAKRTLKMFGMLFVDFAPKYATICEMMDIQNIKDIDNDEQIEQFCNLLKLV